eukprot:Plantae.Rhodophyta-Palmaria_palmata.ctg9952.p1 GENE.Plantae.Rhodophyta-Palmaria_palmata.ctg9952~~Plantae.Rhodophyta-Palmaria_palmata.ctg9952.p1  ORF type:complete len:154 (+),score=17.93 Plantae.Rhodophyta-Palmaria_palmata.ctg9952:180-641(+)
MKIGIGIFITATGAVFVVLAKVLALIAIIVMAVGSVGVLETLNSIFVRSGSSGIGRGDWNRSRGDERQAAKRGAGWWVEKNMIASKRAQGAGCGRERPVSGKEGISMGQVASVKRIWECFRGSALRRVMLWLSVLGCLLTSKRVHVIKLLLIF